MKTIILSLFLATYCFNYLYCYERSNPWIYSGYTEGDMVVSKTRNGLIDPAFRWPHNTVCYQFSGKFTQEEINTIYETLNTGFAGTCIKFSHCDCGGAYVNITNHDDGCFSEVGYQGRPQRVNLGELCIYPETIIHEFVHALGFYHEQSSTDRDRYIRIITENVDPDFTDDFLIPENITSFGQPYDYCSIMHYDIYAFTRNGDPTMEILCPTDCDVGFVTELSQVDKNKINIMYDCGEDYPIIPVPDPCPPVEA